VKRQFSDIEILERRIDAVKKAMRGDKTLAGKLALYERVMKALEEGKSARSLDYDEEEREMISEVALLTIKPIIYAANISEADIGTDINENKFYCAVKKLADEEKSEVIPVCAEIEAQIAELDDDEKGMFLEDLGIEESGLDRLIKASYSLLGLISYLTAGPKEVRAWTITKGTKAPGAAGKIHSDFERGFIRAEIVSFDDLVACGSMNVAKEKGLVRSEGKEYVIQDGDIVLFRFNV
jgi:GTP-binding protein YchF